MTTAPTSSPSPIDGVVEFFTLARAGAQLGRLGETGRKQVASVLALGRQRSEAAETLWSNGHTAEGLRLAFAALDATLDAATALADALKLDDAPPPKAAAKPAAIAPSPAAAPANDEIKLDTGDAAKAPDDAASVEPSVTDAAPETGASAAAIVSALAEPEPEVPATTDSGEEIVDPSRRWRAALASRGTRAARVERVSSTVIAMRDASLPTLDADVSPALADLFQRVMDARHVVDAAVGSGAWTAGDMRWARVRRWLGASITIVAVVTGSYFALHEPEGVFASASDVWQQNATFSADMAIDGRTDTWWILPDRSTGWVEERISPGRHVDQVELLNTSNAPSHDRGTSDYRLEIYAGGTLARSIPGHFDWADAPTPVTHDIGMDGVERVRFVVLGYHRTGGGLAEMTVR